ncbi:hypothetical protein NT6N_31790 [Oceaniferula spumae]|uniref:PEP-CTERM protein-sorting domain-containing protein n=1 Tax=Oceaniferula spumae TaxID=2979115 RepID=A0AAT9FQ57_9BACT
MNTYSLTCGLSAFFLCTSSPLMAQTVVGVTGDAGFGNLSSNSFYEIDTANGTTTLKGSSSITPNQLAFDVVTNNYYYMDHYGSNFYRFDIDTGTEYNLADLTTVGMPVDKIGSGGGDFYNGRYYYTPESGSQGIYQISFNSDGSGIQSHTEITPHNLGDFSDLSDGSSRAGLGDFGDVAVNTATGKMYGTSNMHNNGTNYTAFWSIDLNDPNYTMELISTSITSVYQLAFDEANILWANQWASDPGETRGQLVSLNLSNGEIESTRTMTNNGDDTLGDFYDLASTNIRQSPDTIPEPSQVSLFAATALLTLLRRSRK